MIGLFLSTLIHFSIIGSYYIGEYFGEEEAPVVKVRLLRYSELGPPPSITNTEQTPTVGVTPAAVKPSIGVPVPVPDVEVSPEQTLATQAELSQVQSPVIAEGISTSNIVVEQDIGIEVDPEPDKFIPVEKPPIPVKQVKPIYPEIARRAGVEGTVWVNILVDKQGKAKKAIIVKSDAEIFNEPAIEAALQWLFTPAMMNNGPVTVWVTVPFRFQLATKEQS